MSFISSPLGICIFSGIIFFIAWILTGWIYRYTLKNKILDHPNDRSLHTDPVPRGGGVSISILVLLTTTTVWLLGYIDTRIFIGLVGGGGLVAITGWVDDRYGMSAFDRGLIYLLAASWLVYWISGFADTEALNTTGIIISIIAVSWLTNLYNFMDGSDGLAATQAVCAGIMMTIILYLLEQPAYSLIIASLTASALGFLMWNWPPARIFMGDAGSCLIGFMIAALALLSILQTYFMLTIWLIVLSVFICDATLTLFKRMIYREKWYRAHRKHAYQRWVQMGYLHKHVNYFVIIINLCLVIPAVIFIWTYPAYRWWTTITIYALLSGIWLFVQIKYSRYALQAGIND